MDIERAARANALACRSHKSGVLVMRIAVGDLTAEDSRKPVKTDKAKPTAKKRAKAGGKRLCGWRFLEPASLDTLAMRDYIRAPPAGA